MISARPAFLRWRAAVRACRLLRRCCWPRLRIGDRRSAARRAADHHIDLHVDFARIRHAALRSARPRRSRRSARISVDARRPAVLVEIRPLRAAARSVVPPRTKIASAFASGSSTTSHEPRPRQQRRWRGGEPAPGRWRCGRGGVSMCFSSDVRRRTSGPTSRGRKEEARIQKFKVRITLQSVERLRREDLSGIPRS